MKIKTNPQRNRAVTGLLLSMLAIAGCASSGARPAVADAKATPAGPATRSELLQPGIAPLQPNANPTDAELRDYWERTIVRPLRSGRLRGRVVTKSGRPMEGIRVESVLTRWDARGRNPARPESVVVTDANGTFDLPAEVPRRNEQFMLHVQQLPYILQVWQLGLVGAGQPDTRAKQSRGEGTLAFNTAFDPVAARGMLARGELMPSTAIDGGVDVVVRRLADETQFKGLSGGDPSRLAALQADGSLSFRIDEKTDIGELQPGDPLIGYPVAAAPTDQTAEPILVRVPLDGYYGIVAPDSRDWQSVLGMGAGFNLKRGDLLGFVRDKYGLVVPMTSRSTFMKPRPPLETGKSAFGRDPTTQPYVWTLLQRRPNLD